MIFIPVCLVRSLHPAQAISVLIAGMHDQNGRITLPGFYDQVRDLSPEEHQEFAGLPIDDDYYKRQTGVSELWGESGYTSSDGWELDQLWMCTVCIRVLPVKGQKTVIPSWAMAKISMRLVPDQDPQEVHQQFIRYLEMNALPGIHWELTNYQAASLYYRSIFLRHPGPAEACRRFGENHQLTSVKGKCSSRCLHAAALRHRFSLDGFLVFRMITSMRLMKGCIYPPGIWGSTL